MRMKLFLPEHSDAVGKWLVWQDKHHKIELTLSKYLAGLTDTNRKSWNFWSRPLLISPIQCAHKGAHYTLSLIRSPYGMVQQVWQVQSSTLLSDKSWSWSLQIDQSTGNSLETCLQVTCDCLNGVLRGCTFKLQIIWTDNFKLPFRESLQRQFGYLNTACLGIPLSARPSVVCPQVDLVCWREKLVKHDMHTLTSDGHRSAIRHGCYC